MSADTTNLRPELYFNHYIDVTDNISINLADLDFSLMVHPCDM